MATNNDVPEGHKRCSRCKAVKPVSEFYRRKEERDGLHYYCKACIKSDMNARYHADIEKARQQQREYRRNHLDAVRARDKALRARNIDKIRERERLRPQPRNDVVRARDLVFSRIRNGKMPKASTQTCAHCGAQAREYHHEDYSKPLTVVALCRHCHNRVHGRSID